MKQTTRGRAQRQESRSGSANQKSGRSNSKNGHSDGESLLEKFFVDQLKDIYYAEEQIIKALPKMAQATTTEELEDAFNDHLRQTERHVKRLEKVFQSIGKEPEGKKCPAIDGIIKEAEEIMTET
ncbi:MAG TPA: DUF892 family protein, partial [Chitinophagaceae bacterium]